MIAGVLTILFCTAAGWPLAGLFDPRSRIQLRLSTAFLLGSALSGAILFVESLLHLAWSRAALVIPMLIVALAGMILPRASATQTPVSPIRSRYRLPSRLLDAVTLAFVAGYSLYATVAPTIENDFIGIWGLKAREFWLNRGIDWRFLEHPFNEFAHVDYPILLPLLFNVQTLIRNAWDVRWLGIWNIAFGVAALLALRVFLEEETENRLLASVASLSLMAAAFSPWIGLAEGPLVACGTAGLLYIRRGVHRLSTADVLRGAVLLGIAGSFKNEGIALIAAAAIALLVTAPSLITRLWPAAVVVGPWILLRRLHHLQTDLTSGPMLTRLAGHAANLQPMLTAIARYTLGRPLFWGGVALALLLTLRRSVSRERFLSVAIVMQIAFFLAAYMVTPHDVTWHVRWSWERVVNQLTLTIGFLTIVLLAPLLEQKRVSGPVLPLVATEDIER